MGDKKENQEEEEEEKEKEEKRKNDNETTVKIVKQASLTSNTATRHTAAHSLEWTAWEQDTCLGELHTKGTYITVVCRPQEQSTAMIHFACVLTVAAAALSSATGASLVQAVGDVPLQVGSALHLDCGVQRRYRYCLWEAEDGRVFQVEDVRAGRHVGLRAPHNLTHNQCGIVVEQAAARDAGRWTCRVFLQGKALTTVRNVRKEAKGCTNPFVAVGTDCFYFNPDLALNCLSTDADLEVVDDYHQQELIWGHIMVNYGPNYFWLGATDEYDDEVWRWVDGTHVPMGTPFWSPNEPNNLSGNENCLTIQSGTGYFNDLNCTRETVHVMCQDSNTATRHTAAHSLECTAWEQDTCLGELHTKGIYISFECRRQVQPTAMIHFACILTVAAAALSSATGASLVQAVGDVPLQVGSALHLDCGVQGRYRYCLWEAEDGRVFQVEDVRAGRHVGLRAPHNLTHNQCGIVVEQAAARDAGRWTCRVFLQGKALTTVRNVRKEAKGCTNPFVAVGTGCFYFNPDLALNW
ncbi:hypothetical protein O3P69_002772 [Scylla paramamosain]